jgi:hypothetical protein
MLLVVFKKLEQPWPHSCSSGPSGKLSSISLISALGKGGIGPDVIEADGFHRTKAMQEIIDHRSPDRGFGDRLAGDLSTCPRMLSPP